ncbi:MAG: T9SS type A sorting domain-containing protein [Bacteroidales bacterium]|nr:T9SS type A sorting domain-containing protein [Bacteroidales bacterium]
MKTNLNISLILIGLILAILMPVNSNAQLNWDKYENNPVLQVQPGTWYSWNVFFPVVIFDDDMFKMWFCGNNSSSSRHIGYVTSPDGLDWDIWGPPVIVMPGDQGEWDAHKYPGTVLLIDDTLRMWYSGSTNSSDNGSIGYAWSVEQYVWNELPLPVLEAGESGAWDDVGVFHPAVYYNGTMYHMYYGGTDNNLETMQIGHATSSNGINWEKDEENNPVIPLGPPGSFYSHWIIARAPIMHDGALRMLFVGFDGTTTYANNGYFSFMRVGYASSTDYVAWNIHPDPVLSGDPGEWDETIVSGPSVMIHEGIYKMWYWGDHFNSNFEIGYAESLIVEITENNIPVQGSIHVSPSPFTDNVTISYTLQEKSMIEIEIYNYNGQQIFTLVKEVKQQGKHEVLFEGRELKPGVYFCLLKTSEGIQTKKIIKLH